MEFERLRTILVDDERFALRRLRDLLAPDPDIVVIASCTNGPEAVDTIAREAADLLFLDIQMPGMDGFGVLRRLAPERVPVTIFVTAHDQHALRALNASAVDYLLKPFTRARFAQALGRAKILCRAKDLDLSQHAAQWTSESTKIAVRRGRTMLWIQVAEIDWIEAANNYICLHCGSRSDIVRETLQNVEQRLGPARFLRIHRSILVNRDAVRELHPSANGDAIVVLRDGTSLHASRTYRRQLLL